jgi:hypothetical protein
MLGSCRAPLAELPRQHRASATKAASRRMMAKHSCRKDRAPCVAKA